MDEAIQKLSAGENSRVRADLLDVLGKSGKAGGRAVPSVVNEALRILEMIRHFQGEEHAAESAAACSVREALHLVLRAMHYEFPMQHITVSKFIPPDLDPIPVRQEHLETVFFQLLYRARQVLGACGGMIVVKIREKDYLSADNRHKKTFVIEISDSRGASGEGAPKAEDPMSLALVTSLAEYYGGSCRSAKGPKGTIVVVEVPA